MSLLIILIDCNISGLVKKLIKEYGNKIGLVLIDDFLAPDFNPEQDIYKEQLEKNLTINVLKKVRKTFFFVANFRS